MGWHTKTRSKLAKAAASVCMEGLENRQMLTTLQGGDVFIYKDAKENLFRITVQGNTRAEFVAAAVDDQNNVTLGDLLPRDVTDGADLFAIYVEQADWDSVISIEEVTIDSNNGRVTPTPFNGNITLNTLNLRDGQIRSMATNGGTGNGYLGARTVQVGNNNNNDDRPILSIPLSTGIGVMPAPDDGFLSAGLVVADDQDLGKFLFDGTITGNVDVHGSMSLFYSGNILTGDAFGAPTCVLPGDTPEINFNVDGDLRNLVISGSIGTDNTGSFGAGDDPLYLTGLHMRVGGHLGQVDVTDAFAGTLEANEADRYFHNKPAMEIETRGTIDAYSDGFLNDT